MKRAILMLAMLPLLLIPSGKTLKVRVLGMMRKMRLC